MAMDNLGTVYASITSVNTDSRMMTLYIKELVKLLDREDQHWRKYTTLTHDGAPYIKGPGFMETLKELHVPFAISGPHSYNTNWIEMLFAAIKSGVMDLEDQPLGK